MSEYCNCCSDILEWLEVHHWITFDDILDRDAKEIANRIWENSKEEFGKNVPALNELIVLIENIQCACQPASLRRVSIHEAGHAVMEYHYGNIIESIQVGGNIDAAGIVNSIRESDFENKLKETDQDKAANLFMVEINKFCHIMLAGVAAEHIYEGKIYGRKKEILPTLGHKVDIDNCKNFLKTFIKFSGQDQDIYSQFFPEVVKILEEKWNAVTALAQSLEDKWSDDGAFIAGEEAEQIIKKSLTTKA